MENKIKKINFNHSFIFFLFCNVFSLITFVINNFTVSPLICLLLILSIGISHGSLDNLKGEKLFKIFGINNLLIFYLLYILIAMAVIILWILMPSISLIIFLIVASYHFGKEDTQFLVVEKSYLNQLLFFIKGTLIVLAPIYFHFDETVNIFEVLLINNKNFLSSIGLPLAIFNTLNGIVFVGFLLISLSIALTTSDTCVKSLICLPLL